MEPLTGDKVRRIRRERGESQKAFWSRFGVTQSASSRYECGNPIPAPLQMLVRLFLHGTVSEFQLRVVREWDAEVM